jgi:hypothetical protein
MVYLVVEKWAPAPEVPDTFRGNKKSRSAMGVRHLGLRGVWNHGFGKHNDAYCDLPSHP